MDVVIPGQGAWATVGDVALVVLGLATVGMVLWDAASTVVAVTGGAGPVARRLLAAAWRVLGSTSTRNPTRRLRVAAGPLVLFMMLATWVIGLVFGWSLVFAAGPWGQPGGGSEQVPGPLDVLGYTLGAVVGQTATEIAPLATAARVAELVAVGTGALVVSLVVAFVLPVVSAVVDGRRLSGHVSALGHTPDGVLGRAWDGEGFGELELHLIALTPDVLAMAEKHLAYPVLFYFTSHERHTSLPASLAVLDETLTLVDCCTARRLPDSVLVPLRVALSEFLDTLQYHHLSMAEAAPPVPVPGDLRDRGVELLDDHDLDEVYGDIEERRRLLGALVTAAGWEWSDLVGGEVADMDVERWALRRVRPHADGQDSPAPST